uniref:Uncharacterized protein n=1 Tax=Glossina pallidipes TaxID=7398 RepID=A0A1B0A5S1_GLOPL
MVCLHACAPACLPLHCRTSSSSNCRHSCSCCCCDGTPTRTGAGTKDVTTTATATAEVSIITTYQMIKAGKAGIAKSIQNILLNVPVIEASEANISGNGRSFGCRFENVHQNELSQRNLQKISYEDKQRIHNRFWVENGFKVMVSQQGFLAANLRSLRSMLSNQIVFHNEFAISTLSDR